MENKKKNKKKRGGDTMDEPRQKGRKKHAKKVKYNHAQHWLDDSWDDQVRI